MAANESYGGRNTRREPVPAGDESSYMRRPLFPAVRWGAVLAGVAVGVSVQLALSLLGIATGLSTTDLAEGEPMGVGALLWAGFSMLVAAFVGGYVAARMSGLKRKADGVLHGAVSWAVTTILFAALATSVGGSLVSGVFGNMGQLARHTAAGDSPVAALLRTQGVRIDPDALRQLQDYLQAGQREQATQLVASMTGVDAAKAASLVDQALILSGSTSAASPQGRAATEQAMRAAGTTAWIIFGAVALALAIGISGGALGVAGSRRVSWAGNTNLHR
ncbi:hypothetical protein [Noviherbaspirillum galbum]|uniref:PhnA-like protein n=1 Tax=Noviherbaspirillum galbum TaxID=2709383 RepID=A0A6B3SHM3_9BURK|nr:hypothetical protein [Noviherbaspirillum galbum]NEX60367.1 hypothetical protein [Noviherbaspirillum galbum]